MGFGDMLSSVFGGGNSYSAATPPMMGPPRQPNETDEQYQQRVYQQYQNQMGQFQGDINQGRQQGTFDINQQNALAQALQGRMGQNIDFSGAQGTLGQNQGLINQLLAQGRGQGPNPALEQLRMTTDQNIKSQAAQVASARGVNPALAARIAAQQGAGIQQGAVGQAALQSAQQQLASQSQAGQLLGQQAGLQTQMAGMNAQQQQAYAALLAQQLQGMRSGSLSQQAQANQAQLGYQTMLGNQYANMNNVNAGVAAQNAATNMQYGMAGMSGLSGAVGGALSMFSEGGKVPAEPEGHKKADIVFKEFGKGKLKSSSGKEVTNPKQAIAIALSEQRRAEGHAMGGEVDDFHKAVQRKRYADGGSVDPLLYNFYETQRNQAMNDIERVGQQGRQSFGNPMENVGKRFGGFLKNVSLPGGSAPGDFESSAGLGGEAGAALAVGSKGGKVGGQAEVGGDSESNDTVPAMLSPGEIVIPRSKARNPDEAHEFLDRVLKRRPRGYGDVLAAKNKRDEIAKMWGGGCYE